MSGTKGEWIDMGAFKIPATVKITDGTRKINDSRGLFVLHAALLCTGKVLMFCGHTELAHYATVSYVWDPAKPNDSMKPIPFPASMDLFCCHYVTVPDGRLLVIGGSLDFHTHGDRSFGANNVCFFKPDHSPGGTGKWYAAKRAAKNLTLGVGRWYPTLVLAGDGEVLIFSGRTGPTETTHPFRITDWVELIVLPKPGTLDITMSIQGIMDTGGNSIPVLPIYPGLHMVGSGKIYFTGTTWGQEITNPKTLSVDWAQSATLKRWKDYGIEPNQPRREEGMSVLLPPAQDGKILLVGGSTALNVQDKSIYDLTATPRGNEAYTHIFHPDDPKSAEILETAGTVPVWKNNIPKLNNHRTCSTCVILPDSTVLIVGGHNGFKWFPSTSNVGATTPSLPTEIWDGTNFVVMDDLHHPRMYHSIALLLPDGSVIAAGGADPNEMEPFLDYPTGWSAARYGIFFNTTSPARENPVFRDRGTNLIYFTNAAGNAVMLQVSGGALSIRTLDPVTNAPIPIDTTTGNPIMSHPQPPHTPFVVNPANGIPFTIPLNRKDYEIFKPTYFFKTARPKITKVTKNGTASKQMDYDDAFVIETPQGSSITKVALMRLGCITHHTDSEQRYIKLTITANTATSVSVKMPPKTDKHIATPGYYMLWIIDDKNMPCEKAVFVQLISPPKTTP